MCAALPSRAHNNIRPEYYAFELQSYIYRECKCRGRFSLLRHALKAKPVKTMTPNWCVQACVHVSAHCLCNMRERVCESICARNTHIIQQTRTQCSRCLLFADTHYMNELLVRLSAEEH